MAYKFEKVKSVEERLDDLEAFDQNTWEQGHDHNTRIENLEGKVEDVRLQAIQNDQDIEVLIDRVDTLENSGGGSTVTIDTTLTQPNQAADAAAVGAKLTAQAGEHAAMNLRILALEQGGGGSGGGASGGGSSGGGSSGGALDAEIYIVQNLDGETFVWTALEFVEQQMNITCKLTKHFVSAPPTTIAPPTVDADGDYIFEAYIVESTGVVYISGALAGIDVVSLGALVSQDPSADKGWSDDIGNETGVYTVRSVGTYDGAFETIHLFVQNSDNEIPMTKHQWEKIQKSFHKTILEIRLLVGWRIRLYPTFTGKNTSTKTPDYCYSALVWGSDQTARAWQAWANDGNIVLNNRVVAS